MAYIYNETITNALKDVILRNDHWITGNLWNSISIYVDMDRKGISMEITAMHYLEYLWDSMSVGEQFLNHPHLKAEIERLVEERIRQIESWKYNPVNKIRAINDILDNLTHPIEIEFIKIYESDL